MSNDYMPKHNENKSSISQKKKKRRIKKKAVMWALVFLIFFIVLITSLVKIIFWFKDNNHTDKIIDDISNSVEVEEVLDTDKTELINEDENKESDYWYYVKQSLISVDINTLKEKNNDTIGWIKVNNTNVNYPFVHTNNNEYYLNHAFDKSYNSAGWVFLDYRNNQLFTDKNNILYAHARRDNTMFGSLRNVIKESWYSNKDNHIIKMSTEKENTMWQIFSVYRIETESYYITTEFANDQSYEKFLKTIKERSMYDFDVTLSSSDKILTLSTCNGEDHRIVIHAKLIKKVLR